MVERSMAGDSDRSPLPLTRVVADIRRAMPLDGIVALDNGIYKLFFARNYLAQLPNTLLLDNALASMGSGLPSAMAAKLVYPNRMVLAVCGDGGFMMNPQELETARRLQLDLPIVILNNNGFEMVARKQRGKGYAAFAVSFGNPDFTLLAQSFGASGYRIESAGEFLPRLQECLRTRGVHVIDLPVADSED